MLRLESNFKESSLEDTNEKTSRGSWLVSFLLLDIPLHLQECTDLRCLRDPDRPSIREGTYPLKRTQEVF